MQLALQLLSYRTDGGRQRQRRDETTRALLRALRHFSRGLTNPRRLQELNTALNQKAMREVLAYYESEQPDPKALETKISVYEELLNMKKEHLLEKELILEEITMKSDELRKRALDNRERTIEIADRINKFQGEIKKLTKKRMALISELSMFQALSLKQEQTIGELKDK